MAERPSGIISPMDILVPVCRRPHKVPALVDSIRATTPLARILFITDVDDGPEQDAISQADCEWIAPGAITYAQKINAGVRYTDSALIVFAADDLIFLPGWYARAAFVMGGGGYGVVGLNDGIPRSDRPTHATHFLVRRSYAERPCAGGEPGPLHEGYRHWYTDDEFISTARARGHYQYAENARIYHEHPCVGGNMDTVYQVGYDFADQDRAVFEGRRHLWLG